MNFNLVDLVTDYLSDSLVNKISAAIDSDSTLTQSALDDAIPLLLGSLQTQSSKPHSAESIFTAVSHQNGGILKSFDEILSTNNHVQLASTGNNILTTALGQTEKDTITEDIANFSGLDEGTTSTLLGLITPVTLSLVKLKLLDSGQFNSTSLALMLHEQQGNITSALPSKPSTKLFTKPSTKLAAPYPQEHKNSSEDTHTKTNIESASTTQDNTQYYSERNTVNNGHNNQPIHEPTPNQYTANSSFWLTKVLPLLLFTAVLYLAFNIMFKDDKGSNKIEPVSDAASTSLTRIQKPLSRNRSSSYQTNINQHMQPTSKSTTPKATAMGSSSISNVENTIESNAQIEIAQNLQSELDNSLSQVANTLGKIIDIPSAKLAAADIRKVTARINELTELSKTMPDAVKERLEGLITSNLPRLQALTKNANDIPNVGEVIKSPIQALAASLTNFL